MSRIAPPTFSEIRALWEAQGGAPGSLPPLAGAAGWLLHVPPQEAKQPGKEGPGKLQTASQQLLGGNSTPPTLMEKWDMLAIRVPVAFYLEWAEVPASLATVRAELLLRRGGDIVWSQAQEAEGSIVSATGELIQIGNLLFSDSFINPIEVRQGQSLQLEIAYLWQGVKETVQSKLLVSQYAFSSTKFERQEGIIQYNSTALSGHRTL